MELDANAFASVRHLAMGKMKYDWLAVTECLKAFPCIQELMLSFNVIQTISDVEESSNIMKLTEISLENNLISDWNEVLKLGKIPWLVDRILDVSVVFTIQRSLMVIIFVLQLEEPQSEF